MLDELLRTALDGSGAAALRAIEALGARKGGAKALTAALADDRPAARARAAQALGQLGHADAAAKVAGLLKDGSARVRAGAAEALGRLGDSGRASALISLLADESPDVRRAAAVALGDLGAGDAAGPLADGLDDPAPAVRRAMATALAACGPKGRKEGLVRRLHDPDAGVRTAAAQALAGSAEAAVGDALWALLERDRNEAVRVAGAAALASGEGPAVAGRLAALVLDRSKHVRRLAVEAVSRRRIAEAAPALMDALRDGPQPEVRCEAARALGRLGANDAVERLTVALVEDDPTLRAAAEEALTAILGRQAAPGALRADGHIAQERWDAAAALGKAAIAPLIRALSNPTANPRNVAARCGAARALGAIGRKEAVPALLEALTDHAPQLRRAAAQALGAIGEGAARAGLVAATADLTDTVRTAAVRALGRLGADDAAVDAVLRSVSDVSEDVRRAGLEAVGALGGGAVAVARRGLASASLDERLLAVAGLSAVGTAAAKDALHEALIDHSGAVRETARSALAALGWRPVGFRARRTDPGFARWYRFTEWVDVAAESREAPDQVAVLIAGLADADPVRRRAAAETLADTGDPRAAPALRSALGEAHARGDADMGAAAGVALLSLGVPAEAGPAWIPTHVARGDFAAAAAAGEAAVPALAAELEHPCRDVRRAVAATLGALGGEAAAGALLRAWDDRDDDVAGAAWRALCAMPPAVRAGGARRAGHDRWRARALAMAADAGDPEGRAAALDLLAGGGGAGAAEALLAALDGDQPGPQRAALRALVEREDAGAVGAIEAVVARAPDPAVRREAARALAALAGGRAAPALAPLLLSEDPDLAAEADRLLRGLLGAGYDRAACEVERLAGLERWDLLAQRGAAAVPALRAAAQDALGLPAASRAAAVPALVEAGGGAVGAALEALLVGDPAAEVRLAACTALSGLGRNVLAALADPAPAVRAAAARAAGVAGAGPEVLVPLLHDRDAAVVAAAVEALVLLGARSLPALVAAAGEVPAHPARRQVLQALGALGDPAAADPLIAALSGADPADRHAARQALAACGWRPVGWRTRRTDPGYARWTLRSEWVSGGGPAPAQAEVLAAALFADPDPVRRRMAAETLGELSPDDPGVSAAAVPALAAALADESEDIEVRIVAAQSAVALGVAPDPAAPAWTPFWAAAGRWDLAKAHPAAARPALLSMIGNPAGKVRLGAVTTLIELFGRPGAAGPAEHGGGAWLADALRPLADDPDRRVAAVVAALLDPEAW